MNKDMKIMFCIIAVWTSLLGVCTGVGIGYSIKKETPVYIEVPKVIYIVKEAPPDVLEEEPIEPDIAPQAINNDFDILTPCGYTREQLVLSLADESHQEMLPYVDTLLEAEQKYGVNAFYLMCQLGFESGWCRYTSGENNIGGWTNGKGGYKDFDSVDDCILHIAEGLSTDYKEKVGTRLEDVCYRYCPNEDYLAYLMCIMEERTDVIMKGE